MFGIGDFFVGTIPVVMDVFRVLAEFFAKPVPEWVLQFTTLPLLLLAKFYDVINISLVYTLTIINALIEGLPDAITPNGFIQISNIITEIVDFFANNNGEIYFETIYNQMIEYSLTMPTMVYLFIFSFGIIIVIALMLQVIIITQSILEVIFDIIQIVVGTIDAIVPG